MPDGTHQWSVEGTRPAQRQHAEAAAAAFDEVLERNKEAAETHELGQAELDLSKEKDFIDIREATEDQVLENCWYSWDPHTNELIIYYNDKTFPESEEYGAIENVERALEEAAVEMPDATTEEAQEAVVTKVQTAYDAAKIWSLEEQAQITQYTKEAQESSDASEDASEVSRSEIEPTAFAAESQQLERQDIEANRLIAELYRDYPEGEAVPRPKEVEIYINQLWEIKQQIETREATLTRLLEDEVAERDVRLLTPDLQQFFTETEQTLQQIKDAKDAIGTIPEVPLETQSQPALVLDESQRVQSESPDGEEELSLEAQAEKKLQELKELVFAKVDRVPHRTSVERAAVDQLMREYEAAELDQRETLAANLEHFIEELGKTPPDVERLKLVAEQLVTEFEIDHVENPDLVMTAHSMNELLLETIAERPQEQSPVDQLIEEKKWQQRLSQRLANLEQLKTDHENDVPVVLEEPAEPEWTESRIPNIPRRKDITPESLDDATDRLPILVNTTDESNQSVLQTDYKAMYGDKLGQQVLDSIKQQHELEEKMYGPRFNQVMPPEGEKAADKQAALDSNTPATASAEAVGDVLRREGQTSLEPTFSDTTPPDAEAVQQRTREKAASKEAVKTQKRIAEKIQGIEGDGISRFDRWLGEVVSPVEVLAEEPFEEFEVLVTLPKNEFVQYVAEEHPDVNLKYEVLQQWAPYLKDLKMFAARNPWGKRTTKAVIEGYIQKHIISA